MSDVKHPTLDQFRRELDRKKVSRIQADGFDKWRNGKKCEGELKIAADELWARYQKEMGGAPASAGQGVVDHRLAGSGHGDRGGDRGGQRGGGQRGGGQRDARGGQGGYRPPAGGGQQQVAGRNANAADPSVLGEPFHNPYTFIPFADISPRRRAPTPLTIDELEPDRFTGTVEIELATTSPLLTCSPKPVEEVAGHKRYQVLAIGNDVIVPATGVRGALRTLMTIITGGTLGYLDDEVWLCQGRDARLGPAAVSSPDGTPPNCFLARVEEVGDRDRPGRVRLGLTKLIKADDLSTVASGSRNLDEMRPQANKRPQSVWIDDAASSIQKRETATHRWQLKLSGRPINPKGKREGAFLGDGPVIELPPHHWSAYAGRNRHGDHPELRKGDLIWLEPVDFGITAIRGPEDIASIQWARWGRHGEQLLKVVEAHHGHLLPDSLNSDGHVDEVTDLFGQTPAPPGSTIGQGPGPAGPFAARIRPENLVFFDAVQRSVERAVPLAPLAPPHPGCAAFYRDWDGTAAGLDETANRGLPLRGYKVYRATAETGPQAPWRFSTQGVYGANGTIDRAQQKVNKTCDLLQAGATGHLRLACRGLTARELALLFAACAVDWRIGGGKPLGLGSCRISTVRAIDEEGTELHKMSREADAIAVLPAQLMAALRQGEIEIEKRMHWWQGSQRPVPSLRYPRAVIENKHRKSRGGHVWFARHASPKKTGEDYPKGLETLWTEGELKKRAGNDQIRAQALPQFTTGEANGGRLFGYDLFSADDPAYRETANNKRTLHKQLVPFDAGSHHREADKSEGKHGQSRESREHGRRDRSAD